MATQVNELSPGKVREVICYLRCIANWEDESDKAEKYVGKPVHDWTAVRIYITGRHGFIYAHSN